MDAPRAARAPHRRARPSHDGRGGDGGDQHGHHRDGRPDLRVGLLLWGLRRRALLHVPLEAVPLRGLLHLGVLGLLAPSPRHALDLVGDLDEAVLPQLQARRPKDVANLRGRLAHVAIRVGVLQAAQELDGEGVFPRGVVRLREPHGDLPALGRPLAPALLHGVAEAPHGLGVLPRAHGGDPAAEVVLGGRPDVGNNLVVQPGAEYLAPPVFPAPEDGGLAHACAVQRVGVRVVRLGLRDGGPQPRRAAGAAQAPNCRAPERLAPRRRLQARTREGDAVEATNTSAAMDADG
eukprot:CAMPEP_0206029804 /NCGR_PEP_ID=MMETSP1464-20131121/47197_1 /ASSEMBLY_ACC=CAM_ASM_001124 /TAXON_ID=119497 /ORGANISM="Exanthemachrysis gayraliae, Strain RCC1523" /LENGTH=291 /DNA_ID=CAMNT_0053403901 /DNA_START=208 /DNA_END=1081 /DNA_ORIENTATION=-